MTVPTLQSGASEAAVQQAIESAGLRWAKGDPVDPTNKKEQAGTFVSSEPASGSKVPAGSVVTYHLAKAATVQPRVQRERRPPCPIHPAPRRTGRTAAP